MSGDCFRGYCKTVLPGSGTDSGGLRETIVMAVPTVAVPPVYLQRDKLPHWHRYGSRYNNIWIISSQYYTAETTMPSCIGGSRIRKWIPLSNADHYVGSTRWGYRRGSFLVVERFVVRGCRPISPTFWRVYGIIYADTARM